MFVAEIMVPCVTGTACRFDWSAIAAIFGGLGALATFIAAWVALWIATSDARARRSKEQAVGHIAFVSLSPILHRAQADMGSVANALIGEVPGEKEQQDLLRLVEGLDAQLVAAQEIVWKLDAERALEITDVIARARMIVRQVRRIAVAEKRPNLLLNWALRDEWITGARTAVNEILAIAEKSRTAARVLQNGN